MVKFDLGRDVPPQKTKRLPIHPITCLFEFSEVNLTHSYEYSSNSFDYFSQNFYLMLICFGNKICIILVQLLENLKNQPIHIVQSIGETRARCNTGHDATVPLMPSKK